MLAIKEMQCKILISRSVPGQCNGRLNFSQLKTFIESIYIILCIAFYTLCCIYDAVDQTTPIVVKNNI